MDANHRLVLAKLRIGKPKENRHNRAKCYKLGCSMNKGIIELKPVARRMLQGWQNCLGKSCDTKSESLFQTYLLSQLSKSNW